MNESPVLRSLVDLGVDLSLVQPTLSSNDIVSLLEFSEDRLAEIVMFLAKEVCIPEEGLGGVLTNNPGDYCKHFEMFELVLSQKVNTGNYFWGANNCAKNGIQEFEQRLFIT